MISARTLPPDGDTPHPHSDCPGHVRQGIFNGRTVARCRRTDYAPRTTQHWFARWPEAVRTALREAWGEPPGTVYRQNGALVVAGLQFGNVFVGIQPPRGFGENPIAIYHDPALAPTHHYLGSYHWLRHVFRADAIVHMGKHGTLEWLPGKGIGMSEACYPGRGPGRHAAHLSLYHQ